MTASPAIGVSPANQKLRIAALRLFFGLALIPVLWGVPLWQNAPLAGALMRLAGSLCIVTAVLGRFWAILYIGGRKNRQVMQDGPYSVCRHPLYLFSTIGAAGFGLMLGSLVLGAAFGFGAFAILWLTARREEKYLRASFGPAWVAYAARVPRILPRPSLFRSEPVVEVNLATLRVNLSDALVFLAAFPLAEAIRYLHDAGFMRGFAIY